MTGPASAPSQLPLFAALPPATRPRGAAARDPRDPDGEPWPEIYYAPDACGPEGSEGVE